MTSRIAFEHGDRINDNYMFFFGFFAVFSKNIVYLINIFKINMLNSSKNARFFLTIADIIWYKL